MILVDSGVLIDYLRTKDARLATLFHSLPVALCGVTRAEILSGARNIRDRKRLFAFLQGFKPVPIPEPLWDRAGDLLAALRAAGVTVPFADAVIAAVALENQIELWARNKHFASIQKAVPQLRLFQEPP